MFQRLWASSIAFDRTYQKYATFDQQGKIQIRRIGKAAILGELPGLCRTNVGWFSCHGNYLVASDSRQTQIWHVDSGRAVFKSPSKHAAKLN